MSTPATDRTVTWSSPERESLFAHWLDSLTGPQSLRPETLRIASADASFRRYLRIDTTSGESRIVMDAPPDKENCQPFVHVAALMQAAGLRAPQVLDWQREDGFMLLTDLGDRTMMSAIDVEQPQANQALYLQAVDTLVQWQQASRPGTLPPYDEALLRRELGLFPDWYLAQHKGQKVEGQMRSMAKSLERDPQAESILRNRKQDLGIGHVRQSESLARDMERSLTRGRSQSMGIER